MAELSGGDLVARVLAQAGVSHVFTLCGGHILPIYDGCLREGIRVIDLRHEQAAAHAADAWARLTRNLGVAIVTAGPGVTDAVTGVANAYSARSPVLLIGGAAPLGLRGLGALQEMEQVALLRPITKGSWSVAETRQIPETLTTAIRAALSGRPESAARIAVVSVSGIWRVSATDHEPFVIGRSSATCSISWRAPRPRKPSGAAPPMRSTGLRAEYALATPVTASVTPGPAVTIATPRLRVRRAQASAACAAACSWRRSMTRIPSRRQPS